MGEDMTVSTQQRTFRIKAHLDAWLEKRSFDNPLNRHNQMSQEINDILQKLYDSEKPKKVKNK